MRQILTRPMIDAFAFGHDEYSDGMGRTYAEVDHDESYDVGRTVAEMPPAWRTLLRAAPDLLRERDALKVERDALLAALREVKRLRDLWRSQDDDAIDSIDYMDGLDRIDVDSVLARATGGAR